MFLTEDNVVYIFEFPHTQKKVISNFGRDFVKTAVCQRFNIPPESIAFKKGAHGKPFLGNRPKFHFNVSHSGNLLAVVFSDSQVGVDIERVREADLKIARRFFSLEEINFVKNNETFFYVWTRKESFIKKTGEGLSRPLPSFNSLENENIKTFTGENYIVSVCNENARDFRTETLENRDQM